MIFLSLSKKDLCDSSSCSVEMGFSEPRACQKAVCNTFGYPSFGTCERNPQLTLFLNLHKGCDDGRCKVCENPQTCKICYSGYALVNGLCTLCPAGTYLTNDQSCKGNY